MLAIFPVLDMYFCIATKWTRHLGWYVTYSALLLKTWRFVFSVLFVDLIIAIALRQTLPIV